jgi:RNA polymerase sigma factor (sigma-70 family)
MSCTSDQCEACLEKEIRYWCDQYHIEYNDKEDCASEFVITALLLDSRINKAIQSKKCCKRFVSICARRFSIGCARKLDADKKKFTPMNDSQTNNCPRNNDSKPQLIDPEKEALKKEFWKRVDESMELLKPLEREALSLKIRDGESISSISSILKISENYARQIIFRGRKHLIEILNRQGMKYREIKDYIDVLK